MFPGIFDSWYWNNTRLLSMRIFTALSASVYKKSLRLSSAGRNVYTTGEVVNLIAVDCSKVQEATMFFNLIFTTPLQIGLAIYFLWQYLNYSILVGKLSIFISIKNENFILSRLLQKIFFLHKGFSLLILIQFQVSVLL